MTISEILKKIKKNKSIYRTEFNNIVNSPGVAYDEIYYVVRDDDGIV